MKKKALVLGATGQDGSYMIDLLLSKNYEVHGMYRKSSVGNTKNIEHLISDQKILNKKFFLHKGDLLDPISLNNIIDNSIKYAKKVNVQLSNTNNNILIIIDDDGPGIAENEYENEETI